MLWKECELRAHISLHKSSQPMINSYLMTMAIVREGGAFFHYCLLPLLLGRDNWFLCGNKVSTTHGSRLRWWFDSKEGWRGWRGSRGQKKIEGTRDEAQRRDKAREQKANKPDNYLQLKNSLALGGCKLDNNLFFRAFTSLVQNIVWYVSVVRLIRQMESILITQSVT